MKRFFHLKDDVVAQKLIERDVTSSNIYSTTQPTFPKFDLKCKIKYIWNIYNTNTDRRKSWNKR
jgi:hypothetical protein